VEKNSRTKKIKDKSFFPQKKKKSFVSGVVINFIKTDMCECVFSIVVPP